MNQEFLKDQKSYLENYSDKNKEYAGEDERIKHSLAKREKALRVAQDVRKFEIEMYWKRATYFWVFISLAFAVYFNILNSDKTIITSFVMVLVSYTGFIFSFGWYLVNRGSKYWQNNWERHVDMLEDEFNGPIYKLILKNTNCKCSLLSSYPFSVSRINIMISLFIVFAWGLLIAISINEFFITFDLFYYIVFGIASLTAFVFLYILAFGMDSSNNVDNSVFTNRAK